MTPTDIAQRLAALDWSATSAQHQLAVSAAVETLREVPVAAVDALKAHKLAMRGAPSLCAPVDSNIVALPVKPRARWTTLFHLDGRQWATSTDFGPTGAWAWVVETVAAEHDVSEDQVSSLEGDESQYDGDDLVTVDGVPVYRLRHVAK